MANELTAPPLSLYVHLPWCVRKCPYCDFNSHALKAELPARAYLAALRSDLAADAPLAGDRPVRSIYFGGGTPSLFSARHIEEIMTHTRGLLRLARDVEVTLEANPGAVERDAFAAYREAGVNRVSLGAQTFDEALLRSIGRIHGPSEIEHAIESLIEAGLENFNLDLMYGLPGQSPAQAVRDLEKAVGSGPAHVSHYQLTLEPNTAFAVSPPELPTDETCWAMQESAGKLLADAGFEQYEISAWARAGRRCRHNLNYWRFGDYLGIGAGAHAKLTDPGRGLVRRMAKTRHPARYMGGERVADDREVGGEDLAFEYFLNVLRLREEIVPAHFSARTGLAWKDSRASISEALNRGLLKATDRGFRATELGWRFSNDLQAIFLPRAGAGLNGSTPRPIRSGRLAKP